MHATVKFGVIKTKPVNISHGGQMGCFKISVFIIQTVENLIFDVWTALQAPEQIAVRINEILKIKTRLKTSFSVKRLRPKFATVEWAAGLWWREVGLQPFFLAVHYQFPRPGVNNNDWDDAARVQYLPLLGPVRQSGAAVEHNGVILTNLMTSHCFNPIP